MSAATIVIAIFFSLVGLAALRYGKREGELRPVVFGVVLMLYGYFVSDPWVSFLVGSVLTVLLFYPQ